MNKIQRQYRRDTGIAAFNRGIESELMTPEIDSVFMQGMTAREIIGLLESEDYKWAVNMDDVPDEYNEADNLILPNPEYIKWLEEKVEELQKLTKVIE